jgi:hypothetical protein
MHPLKCHFWRKCWLFKPQNDIFEDIFWNLLWFSQICRKIIKKFWTLYLWNELAAPRTLKIIENGLWLKKSGHPWSIIIYFIIYKTSTPCNYLKNHFEWTMTMTKNQIFFTVKLKLHNTSYNFNRIILCWDQRKKGNVVFQNFLGFWERQ